MHCGAQLQLTEKMKHAKPDKQNLNILWIFLAFEESGKLEISSQLKTSENDLMSGVPMDQYFPSKLDMK